VAFNRELGELTVAELVKIKHAAERAIDDGLIAARVGLRLALQLTDAVEREMKKRARSGELGIPGKAHTNSRKKRKG